MKQRKKRLLYGLFFIVFLSITFSITTAIYIQNLKRKIPDTIFVSKDNTTTVNLQIPISGNLSNSSEILDFSSPVTFAGIDKGNYQLNLKLFGIIDVNAVSINVIDKNQVLAGGFQTGIYLKTNGILVTKTDSVTDMSGEEQSPAAGIIEPGDYIIKVNGENIESKKDFINYINDINNALLTLTILRNGEELEENISPVMCSDGVLRIGLWVKDDTQGIGTVTYIDGSGHFGALGHGISDSEAGGILKISRGQLYKTNIISIVKGSNGNPGEFVGTIDYNKNNVVGEIDENTDSGIFGTIDSSILNDIKLDTVDIGYGYEVKKGNAQIRMYSGKEYKDYDVNIYGLNEEGNKNITFEVKSSELIDYSNGIIQGMSGCPIMQNGKIIGAVTHVFVDNPNRGYGIFIDKMLRF